MADAQPTPKPIWQTLAEFAVPSQSDSDHQAKAQVAKVVLR